MKNLSFVLLSAFGVLFGFECVAQRLQGVIVKADAVEASKKHLGAAVEWRLDKKNSVEFQLGFRRHNDLGADVFNGDWTTDYTERRTYFVSLASSTPIHDTGWEYLGTGRPLPDATSPIMAVSTLYARVGYGMSFQKKPRGFRIILLPGISVSRHRYFEVNDKITRNEIVYENWQVGSNQTQEQFVEQTAFYTQTRQMREKNSWVGGATYAFGFAWQAKFGLSLEARLTAGVNFGDAPYSRQNLPAILGNYYGQGAFLVGWAFQ